MRRWMSVVSHSGFRPLDLCKEAALDTYVFMVPGARPCFRSVTLCPCLMSFVMVNQGT